MDETLSLIKSRLPMTKFYGADKYIKCPAGCEDSRKTCEVYDDALFCHKCRHKEDVFDYIQRTKNVDFVSAKRMAARLAGVPLEANQERTVLLRKIQQEFQNQLFIHQPEKLEELMAWRGWSRRIVGLLGIGYCDPEGAALKRTEIPMRDLVELGFYVESRNQELYFRFADRYVFGIKDVRGDLVSMKGRLSRGYTKEEEDQRKKSLPLFAESDTWGTHSHMDHLYLEETLREAEEKGYLVITEGEPNGVSLRDKGFPVVCLQTNKGLTKHAYKLRNIKRIYVCLDNDKETLKTLLKELYDLQMALPEAKLILVTLPYLNGPDVKVDVDEYFHQHGKTAKDFAKLCKDSPDATHVLIERLGQSFRNYPLIYPLIYRMKNRREELLELFSKITGRDPEFLAFAMDSSQREEKGFPSAV